MIIIENEKHYTTGEAAEIGGLEPAAIRYRIIKRPELLNKIDGIYLIPASNVKELIK